MSFEIPAQSIITAKAPEAKDVDAPLTKLHKKENATPKIDEPSTSSICQRDKDSLSYNNRQISTPTKPSKRTIDFEVN